MEAEKETISVITSAALTVIALIAVWLYRRWQNFDQNGAKNNDN